MVEGAGCLTSCRRSGRKRQTLLVRREGESYASSPDAAGSCAPQIKERQRSAQPCAVMAEGDAAAAIEASIIENVARLPATEMEQYTAFRKLHDEGRAVEDTLPSSA